MTQYAESGCADVPRHSQTLRSPGTLCAPEKPIRQPCCSLEFPAPGTARLGDVTRRYVRAFGEIRSPVACTPSRRSAVLPSVSIVCREIHLPAKGGRDGSSCQASADLHCGLSRMQSPLGVPRRIRRSGPVPEVPKRPNQVDTNLRIHDEPRGRRAASMLEGQIGVHLPTW